MEEFCLHIFVIIDLYKDEGLVWNTNCEFQISCIPGARRNLFLSSPAIS